MNSKTDAIAAGASAPSPAGAGGSLTDQASAAYLQRGRLLDDKVRNLVEQVGLSNQYLEAINQLIAEADSVLFASSSYSSTTWQADFSASPKTITLDNGYGIELSDDGQVVIRSSGNHSVTYADGALYPAQAGSAPGYGITLDGNASIILENGTKITLQMSADNRLTAMAITRGNQGMTLSALDSTPAASGPDLSGSTRDSLLDDGDILRENGGLYNLVNAGTDTSHYSATSGSLTDEQKAFIRDKLGITMNLDGSLSEAGWNTLKNQLIAARDNLTGSNQLQTVQLQSALTRYNQNYDAMSNSQNKIYTLLKDILNNIK